MSDWRNNKKPASFNGVVFFVDSLERTGGRRGPLHEYPFSKDLPYREDTGRKGRTFPVEGFVVGDDYLDQRDALLTQLEATGPGQLVHPTYGTLRVAVDTYRVRESRDEGGCARFTIDFQETAAGPIQPSSAVDGAGAVVASAAAAKTAITSQFSAAFSTLSTIKDGVTAAIRGATLAMNNVLANVAFVTQTAATLQSQISAMASSAVGLASAPGDIVTQFTGIFDSIKDAVSTANNVIDPLGVFLGIYNFNPGTPAPVTTPQRVLEAANVLATQLLVQRLALTQMALIAIELPFVSYEDAITARTTVLDLIDAQAEIAADDTYPALQQMRADLVKAVPGDGSDLPRLLTYTPRQTVPSLVLAQRIYGDITNEADIIARNGIAHPGFVTGQVDLEVLSRGD